MNKDLFDVEKIYDEEISPLMGRIIKICNDNQIPMMAQFCISNEDEEAGELMVTTSLPFDGRTPDDMLDLMRKLIKPKPFIAAFTIRKGEEQHD
jgi:hypothetical protein